MNYSMTIAALAAASTLVVASPIEKRVTRFTVPQVPTGKTVAKNGPQALAKALGKFGAPVPSNVQEAAATVSGTVAANPSTDDEQYTCAVMIGTPSQTLNLDFDTGSADVRGLQSLHSTPPPPEKNPRHEKQNRKQKSHDHTTNPHPQLWVFSSQTKGESTTGHSLYTPTDSSTSSLESSESWKIQYGDGSGASGTVYADRVIVGGVTATSQAVEVATSVSAGAGGQAFKGTDGLLGLASSSINTVSPRAATTWFDTVKGGLDAQLFTATLKHQQPGSYDFGYIDDGKHTGSIAYAPVNFSRGFWQFDTGSYAVTGGASGTFGSAIADTGTTLLLADQGSVITDYYAQVSGSQNSNKAGGYIFDCNATLPDLVITIAGQDVTVAGSLINFAPNGDGTCFGGLQSAGGLGFSILGDVFLKAIYAVFDEGNSQFGFAPQA